MAKIFRTENVQIATTAGTTFTHGLGVAPTAGLGAAFITMRTSTGPVYVSTSNSQIIVLVSAVAAAAVDLCVMRFHSIIK